MRWTIYRQELVLFHPRHKVLRFIQEQDSQARQDVHGHRDFIRYRRHAQQILGTLHKALSVFPKGPFPTGTEVSFKESNGSVISAAKVTLAFDIPRGLTPAILIACLQYCETVLDAEGWQTESPPRQLLKSLISQLNDGKTRVESSGLEKSTLLQLISVLPILPHWDLQGIFSENSDKSNTLLSGIRQVEVPVYAAQLRFPPKQADGPPDSPSERLLDYRVRLRACYCDATRDISSTIFVREDDFYAYCHNPKDSETPLYRAYAVLVDALQAPLAEAEASNSPEKSPEAHDVFYLAYPIKTALGRTHFWHFYLSPERPGGTLDELWKSWWPLHQRVLDWPYLHASLAAELEQLDIGYFQEAILHDLNEARRDKSMAFLDESQLVCSQGHVLFPAYCFCTDKARWRYERNVHHVLNDLGHVWKLGDGVSADGACAEGCTPVGAIRFKTKAYGSSGSIASSGLRPLLLKQRYERLVEQQQFLAGEMIFAMEKRQRLEERELEDWKRSCRRALLAMNVSTRNDLRRAIGDSERKLEDIDIVEVKREMFSGKSLIKQWHGGKNLHDADARRELRLLISLNAHAMVSEFLELNPIKMLTHLGEHKLVDGWDRDSCIAQIDGFLSSISSLPTGQHWDKYKETLDDLCAAARAHLTKIQGPLTPANARCRQLDEDKNNLQIDKGEFKKLVCTNWTHANDLSEAVKPFGNILTKVRLSLPKPYLSNILELSAKVGTFEGAGPILDIFRLPLHVDAEAAGGQMPSFIFQNYLIFRWNGGEEIVNNLPDGSVADGTRGNLKKSLQSLNRELQDVGKCFIGTGRKSSFRELHEGQLMQKSIVLRDIWPEITAEQAKFVSEKFDPAKCQEAVTKVLTSATNILMLVFDSWYCEKVKSQ